MRAFRSWMQMELGTSSCRTCGLPPEMEEIVRRLQFSSRQQSRRARTRGADEAIHYSRLLVEMVVKRAERGGEVVVVVVVVVVVKEVEKGEVGEVIDSCSPLMVTV